MINLVIIEDNKEALNVLKSIISDFFPQIKILAEFDNATQAYVFIKQNRIDLLILDIELEGEINGLELLTLLENTSEFKTVFYTGSQNLMLNALRLGAFDYLTKPLSLIDFKNTITRFLKQKKSNELKQVEKEVEDVVATDNERKLKINTHSNTIFINFSDILYLIANGAYTQIYYKNNNMIKSSKNLSFFSKLLIDESFRRASRSIIFNKNLIENIVKNSEKKSTVIFKDGSKIEISQRIRKQLMQQLN